jgi:DNA-directed RNA polymerase specialized sigma24 family protein
LQQVFTTSRGVGLPKTEPSDECLLQATGKGNLKAFEQIVRRHQTWTWKIAYRILWDEEEAADLVQEAL